MTGNEPRNKRAQDWNRVHPPGLVVKYMGSGGVSIHRTVGPAFIRNNTAYVMLEGVQGRIRLSNVTPLEPSE